MKEAAMIEFRQGFRSMAAPTRELGKLFVSGQLAHAANAVTHWMAANVAVAHDPAGKPQAHQGQEPRASTELLP
jgi:phage terminase large subunit-like protein